MAVKAVKPSLNDTIASKPLVSGIIIFFNAASFIEEAIASAIAQTYDNWELLLVDDGSTDKSTAIAQQFATQYPERVRYLEHPHHKNRGMSASRNLGISHAQGEYIAFLDADDVWLPQKLEQQVTILASQPEAAFVCGRAQWWYGWTEKPEDLQRDFVQQLDVPLDTLVEPPQLLVLYLQNEWATFHDLLLRRSAIAAVGGYEEKFRGMYEDQAFHAKLCLHSTAFVLDECGYRYRQHPTACTHQAHKKQTTYAARKTFLNWLEAYLAQQTVADAEVWQVLQQELAPFRRPLSARLEARLHYFVKDMKSLVKQIGRQTLPLALHDWLRIQWRYRLYPPVGWVRFGSLRRVTPIGKMWPNYRGLPVDRYYIEKFLASQADRIQGRVLELGDATYTRRYGGDRVNRADVLDASADNPAATIVADLTRAERIPADSFDCIILTQALLFIYDLHAAIETVYRILKPGGVALVTVPGITQIVRDDMAAWGQYWSFTSMSAQKLFAEVFPPANVTVNTYGNVLATTAFLYGMATQELRPAELDYYDPDYEFVITVTAVKPGVMP